MKTRGIIFALLALWGHRTSSIRGESAGHVHHTRDEYNRCRQIRIPALPIARYDRNDNRVHRLVGSQVLFYQATPERALSHGRAYCQSSWARAATSFEVNTVHTTS